MIHPDYLKYKEYIDARNMYYVKIKKLNGRIDFFKLASMLNNNGYDDRVEYYGGDECAMPHLRFMHEDDAVAYCLTNGCTMSTSIPLHDSEKLTQERDLC